MSPRGSISLRDFSIGLILALRQKGYVAIDATPSTLHAGYTAAYRSLEATATEAQLRLRFAVILDEHHGISDDVEQVISYALSVGFIVKDAEQNRYLIMVSEADATSHFKTIPGTPSMYEKASEALPAYIL